MNDRRKSEHSERIMLENAPATEMPLAMNSGSTPTKGADTASQPIITVDKLGKTFANGTVALARLDLSIFPGEFISLLGPSGCGKSTALRIIAGLNPASTGTVTWDSKRSEASHDLGFVFQDPTLMPWATVQENVSLPLRLSGDRALAKERVEEVLALVGLADFARSFPRELSGGMKMRVSIARALVTKPRLLLMDEPFAALDEITRFKLNDDLLRLKAELQSTIVFVTHSVYESVYLSTRILVMSARPGRVIREIDVAEPYPRAEAFRRTASYGESCRLASEALNQAMNTHPSQKEAA
jgi:NitT/TauT family transport system ATP-binding protein